MVYRDNPDVNFVKANRFSYAIVVVGETPYAEMFGDSANLTIPEPGPSVISNVCRVVKCVVVIIFGRPVVIEPYVANIDALLAGWLLGSEGQGVANVLFGDYGFTESEKHDGEGDEFANQDEDLLDTNEKTNLQFVANHIDVKEDEEWITIPKNKLPDNWSEAPDISSLCSPDSFFVIPGEQVHIVACPSACKQDTEIITPSKVAAVMNKNGIGQINQKQNGNTGINSEPVSPGEATFSCT